MMGICSAKKSFLSFLSFVFLKRHICSPKFYETEVPQYFSSAWDIAVTVHRKDT